jgi:hypothetical protein
MRRSLLMLPMLVLMSACAQDDSGAAPSRSDPPRAELAIRDCSEVATLAGELIRGMQPTPVAQEAPPGDLLCAWWNTEANSSFSLSVHTHASTSMAGFTDEVLRQGGYQRVPAPAFDQLGGAAAWMAVNDEQAGFSGQLMAQVDDVQVLLVNLVSVQGSGQSARLDKERAVQIASRLVQP